MAHPRETGVSWKPELPTAAQPSIRGGAAPGQEGGMTSVLFTNVRIFDGTSSVIGVNSAGKRPHRGEPEVLDE